MTPDELAELERLRSKIRNRADDAKWEWDGRKQDGDGYVFIPQCSFLSGTGIVLSDTYEGSSEDCDYIAAILNAAPALLALARKGMEQQWVKCSERMPEVIGPVFVILEDPNGVRFRDIRSWLGHDWSAGLLPYLPVVYWQRLPAPPKEPQ